MSDRVPLPSITGLLAGFVAVDLFAGHFAAAGRLVGFQPAVTDPPSGGSVVVALRTATGGGGSGLSATILTGDRFPTTPVTGAIDIPAGTDMYLRLTSEDGLAMNLYGQYIVDGGAGATTALTTLVLVKQYLRETGTAEDTLLNTIVAAVSKRMQTAMRRSIVTETLVAEKYSSDRDLPAVQLLSYPVDDSTLAVTLDGTLLASADYEADADAGLLYYTPAGGNIQPWPNGNRHISIGYDAGFAAVPDDLQHAATVQAAWDFKRTKRLGDRTAVIGDNTATFMVDAWAPEVVPILDYYRMRSF